MLIGLSVSGCIRDIAENKIEERDVAYIISGTLIENREDVRTVVTEYGKTYWRNCEQQAVEIFNRLWLQGRILQPRVQQGPVLNTYAGHWLQSEILPVSQVNKPTTSNFVDFVDTYTMDWCFAPKWID